MQMTLSNKSHHLISADDKALSFSCGFFPLSKKVTVADELWRKFSIFVVFVTECQSRGFSISSIHWYIVEVTGQFILQADSLERIAVYFTTTFAVLSCPNSTAKGQ